jgi:phosphatidylglycerol:prolipoprotein diacylglycerol transferase
VIGARLYYVFSKFEQYHSFLDVINIRDGGLAIYGGLIAGGLTVVPVCYFKKINFLAFADHVAPGVILAQGIGRWGNFMNGEAFGSETTLPWRMRLCNKLTDYQVKEVHPTFLYESLWNLLGFIIINVFYKNRKFRGEVLFWYLSWYGLGRFFIENLRTDSLYLGNTNIRVSALLGLVCFIVALPVIIIGRIRHAKLCKEGIWEKDAIADFGLVFGLKKAEVKSREEMMDLITSMLTTDEIDAAESESSSNEADVKEEQNSGEEEASEKDLPPLL